MENIDLFDYPELIPAQVQEVLDTLSDDTWEECQRVRNDISCYGYTFDFDLGSAIFNLRKIGY